MFGKLVRRVLAVLMVVGAMSLAGPGGQRAEAASVCSGRPAKTVGFATGELRVYKKRQYVCALTVAKRPGTVRSMSVSLQPRGGRAAVDSGRFTRQAGPVTVYALNRCVRVSGAVAGKRASTGWTLC
ncbi:MULTISPECIES: hypothetical protein [unclassified Streptomyces]|uniref:hypothetical protein n=1 Tax=unclassified Streptomyces TaxID=2593676 RepID=UPI000F45A809|nr:hypothetical protein [Streptomyces sp. I6]RNL71186.1 hypothetical protein EBF04_09215 [Streptomyces sp. I6]